MKRNIPIIILAKPGFSSPSQRKWYFSQQNKPATGTNTPKPDRWSEIVAAAREAIKSQPKTSPDELIVAVSNSIDTPLTPSEEERVRKLINPEKQNKTILPEQFPVSERTPEIYELLEQEWGKIQDKKRDKKEEEVEKQLPNKSIPLNKLDNMGTSVDLGVAPFAQPGLYMMGSKKIDFLEKYPELEEADYFRAFQQAAQLLRSDVEDAHVKEIIEEEYPVIDVDIVMKAAKGFLKEGSKDPYVLGREYGRELKEEDKETLASVYADMIWKEVPMDFLEGFTSDLTKEAKRYLCKIY
jgi:hypothetical protein